MAKIISDTTLQAWADAIREKEGSTGSIKVSDMAQRILDLASGGGEFLGSPIETGTVIAAESEYTIPHSLGTIKGFIIVGSDVIDSNNFTSVYYMVDGGVNLGFVYQNGILLAYDYGCNTIGLNSNNTVTINIQPFVYDLFKEFSYLLIGA